MNFLWHNCYINRTKFSNWKLLAYNFVVVLQQQPPPQEMELLELKLIHYAQHKEFPTTHRTLVFVRDVCVSLSIINYTIYNIQWCGIALCRLATHILRSVQTRAGNVTPDKEAVRRLWTSPFAQTRGVSPTIANMTTPYFSLSRYWFSTLTAKFKPKCYYGEHSTLPIHN